MKIVLSSKQDIEDFLTLVRPVDESRHVVDAYAGYRGRHYVERNVTAAAIERGLITPDQAARWSGKSALADAVDTSIADLADQAAMYLGGDPNGLPTDIKAPAGPTIEIGPSAASMRAACDELVAAGYRAPSGGRAEVSEELRASHEKLLSENTPSLRDPDGAQWSADWHSNPPKVNADGRWKARRKRDEAAYAIWLQTGTAEETTAEETTADETAADETAADDQVATETHALPVQPDEPEPEAPAEDASAVDVHALIVACGEASLDASDSIMDLLKAAPEFIKAYSKAEFDALKAAIAPTEDGTGKPLQMLDPAQRRLLMACIAGYPEASA